MNWNEFRSHYYQKNGSTSRQQLAEAYTSYKNNKSKRIVKSPVRSPRRIAATSPKRVKSSGITLNDINQMAKGKKFLIVVLYADWCGHCQMMKKRLGRKMKDGDKIVFISDDRLDSSLKEYYPKIIYFEDSKRQKDLTVDDVFLYLNA